MTNQEDKLNAKEEELQKIRDALAKNEAEFKDMSKKFQEVRQLLYLKRLTNCSVRRYLINEHFSLKKKEP